MQEKSVFGKPDILKSLDEPQRKLDKQPKQNLWSDNSDNVGKIQKQSQNFSFFPGHLGKEFRLI